MSSPIQFENPPVNEVAFSVSFQTQRIVPATFISAFWSKTRAEFPDLSEGAPTPIIVETHAEPGAPATIPQLQMLNMPPLRRSLLRSGDGRRLMQLQQDRFVLNWTRGERTAYPNFASALREFQEKADLLNQTLIEEDVGEPTVNQFELAYVNLIGQGNGLALVPETGLLVDHTRRTGPRFLPDPIGFNWSSTYSLPDDTGRLHIVAQAVLVPPENRRHVRLDLLARSFTPLRSSLTRGEWFELAHEWIVRGFADSTAEVLHGQVWRRR